MKRMEREKKRILIIISPPQKSNIQNYTFVTSLCPTLSILLLFLGLISQFFFQQKEVHIPTQKVNQHSMIFIHDRSHSLAVGTILQKAADFGHFSLSKLPKLLHTLAKIPNLSATNMKITKLKDSSIFLWFSFFCLLLSPSTSFARTTLPARFPSSLVSPEKLSSLSSSGKNQIYRTRYFTQILDHFNFYPKSYQTFQQRYLINDTHWGGAKSNAPIFVYTGNEGNIDWFAQNTGFLYETAPHFKALIVFIEVGFCFQIQILKR